LRLRQTTAGEISMATDHLMLAAEAAFHASGEMLQSE
jgi:hypothetical protein